VNGGSQRQARTSAGKRCRYRCNTFVRSRWVTVPVPKRGARSSASRQRRQVFTVQSPSSLACCQPGRRRAASVARVRAAVSTACRCGASSAYAQGSYQRIVSSPLARPPSMSSTAVRENRPRQRYSVDPAGNGGMRGGGGSSVDGGERVEGRARAFESHAFPPAPVCLRPFIVNGACAYSSSAAAARPRRQARKAQVRRCCSAAARRYGSQMVWRRCSRRRRPAERQPVSRSLPPARFTPDVAQRPAEPWNEIILICSPERPPQRERVLLR